MVADIVAEPVLGPELVHFVLHPYLQSLHDQSCDPGTETCKSLTIVPDIEGVVCFQTKVLIRFCIST